MKSNESLENYLETILMLGKKKYITVMEQGYIFLTDEGKEIAEMIYERHEFLTKWLTSLGVDGAVAAEDACRIEHDISSETFEKLKEHISQPRK